MGAACPSFLRYVHPLDRQRAATSAAWRCTSTASSASGLGGQRDLPVDPGGLAASVALGHPPHADQRVGPAAQVGSDRGAVLVSRPVRFPGPPAAPGVPLSRHRALHVSHSLVSP